MVVELISVGTEILLGNIVNTNAAFLSRKCAELGLSLYYEVVVGDNKERLSEALNLALSRSDIVILSGGLGPTKDDLTKEVTAETLGLPLVMDPHTRARIEEYFVKSNRKVITDNNWKQAEIIEGAIVVDNLNGTAPGLIVETKDNKRVLLLPGPPNEIVPMFQQDMEPYLRKLQPTILYSKMVKICGLGESFVEMEIQDLIDGQTNPTIAPYAKTGEVHLRVTAAATTEQEGKKLVEPIVLELTRRFQAYVYTTEEMETLESHVVELLRSRNLTLTSAESCTGGLFSGIIINVPGASGVFSEGFVTYSNESKVKNLGVNPDTLSEFGAVSLETAKEMAQGAALKTGAKVAISITGLAGPDGGTLEKPVGRVYIGCYVNGIVKAKEYNFTGNREKIRDFSVVNALILLRKSILESAIE